ncbi:insulin-like peptide INSL5 [Narcine bancroftii]|uniref:insulin-like peptide INSL5 n=1 Tax=Narcine bancroftii TaxID=1343680 RepID=UPI003831A80E
MRSTMLLLLPALLALLAVSRVNPERQLLFKLCGRDLMRAAIFTCGGSRWRRGTGTWAEEEETLGANGMQAEFLKSPFNRFHLPKRLLDRLASSSGEEWSSSPDILEEMLKAFPNSPRDKRKFNQTHADICCRRGCTRRQMNFLC